MNAPWGFGSYVCRREAFYTFLLPNGGRTVAMRVDTVHHTHHQIGGEHRRAAVADERQGNAHNGKHGKAHSRVDDDLPYQARRKSLAKIGTHVTLRARGDHNHTKNQQKKGQQHDKAAHKAHLFAQRGVYEVGMRGGQIVVDLPLQQSTTEKILPP